LHSFDFFFKKKLLFVIGFQEFFFRQPVLSLLAELMGVVVPYKI